MDPKTTALLVKIVALFDSPNDGERANAFTKAQELLEKQGQSMADVLAALTRLGVRPSAMTDLMDRAQGQTSAAPASEQAMPSELEHPARPVSHPDQTDRPGDVIARYGSVQAALQPCKWETLLRANVRRDSTFYPPPNERWTLSLCGYTPEQPNRRARDRAMQAIAQSYPLPDNLQDALSEHDHWERRDRELQLILGRDGTTSALDLTAQLRRELVRNLIRSELPVHGEAEFQIRLQFWIDERREEIDHTTLDEAKQLAEMVGRDLGCAIVQSGNATSVLFARWVCDVVVPTLQLPNRSRTRSPLTFDAMLRNAMRTAVTETERQPDVSPGL